MERARLPRREGRLREGSKTQTNQRTPRPGQVPAPVSPLARRRAQREQEAAVVDAGDRLEGLLAPRPASVPSESQADRHGNGFRSSPFRRATRPVEPDVCPYLRGLPPPGRAQPAVAASEGGAITLEPLAVPDAGNACAADERVMPIGLVQQELFCLRESHVDCPLYHRALQLREGKRRAAAREPLPTSIVISFLILGLTFLAVTAYGLSRGGFVLPSPPGGAPSELAAAAPDDREAASPAAVVTPTPARRPSRATGTSAGPSPTPRQTRPAARPAARATPRPTPRPTRRPRATPVPAAAVPVPQRFASLPRCPAPQRCYIYTVRAGDNLYSIANYYRASLDEVVALNPWLRGTGLTVRPGNRIRIPPL